MKFWPLKWGAGGRGELRRTSCSVAGAAHRAASDASSGSSGVTNYALLQPWPDLASSNWPWFIASTFRHWQNPNDTPSFFDLCIMCQLQWCFAIRRATTQAMSNWYGLIWHAMGVESWQVKGPGDTCKTHIQWHSSDFQPTIYIEPRARYKRDLLLIPKRKE